MTTSKSSRHWPQLVASSEVTGPPHKTHLILVVDGGFVQSGPISSVGSRSKSVEGQLTTSKRERERTDIESNATVCGITNCTTGRCVVGGKSLETHVAIGIGGAVEVDKCFRVSSWSGGVQSKVGEVRIGLESGRRVD